MTGLVTKPVLTREHYFVTPQFATHEGGRCTCLCVVQHARESAYCNIIAIILTIKRTARLSAEQTADWSILMRVSQER